MHEAFGPRTHQSLVQLEMMLPPFCFVATVTENQPLTFLLSSKVSKSPTKGLVAGRGGGGQLLLIVCRGWSCIFSCAPSLWCLMLCFSC